MMPIFFSFFRKRILSHASPRGCSQYYFLLVLFNFFCCFLLHLDGKRRKLRRRRNLQPPEVRGRKNYKTMEKKNTFLTVRAQPPRSATHDKLTSRVSISNVHRYPTLKGETSEIERESERVKKKSIYFCCLWPLMVNSYIHILYSLDKEDDLNGLRF